MRHFLIALILTLIPLSTWAETFEGIEIASEMNDPPYDWDLYKHWIDADKDGEKTRQEVLIEESLVSVTLGDGGNGRWSAAFGKAP